METKTKLSEKVIKWKKKWLTKKILDAFIKQGDTAGMEVKDISIICKLFNPTGAGTWYLYEYDPETEIAWCFANLDDPQNAECGTISLIEMIETPLRFGLTIERDRCVEPFKYKLHKVQDKIKEGGHI